MKLLWSITREMFNTNNKVFTTAESVKYTLPYEGNFLSVDVGRLIFLDEASGQIVLETFKAKRIRETKKFLLDEETRIN